MMATEPKEPIVPMENWANVPTYGLTKREYFAAACLSGIITDPHVSIHGAAQVAVKAADALIVELNRAQ